MHESLVILDYGSQYTQLIARRARELGVYSIILPFSAKVQDINEHNPKGIVLSGGPNSVFDEGAPGLSEGILDQNIPVLGICYGMQLISQKFGGEVEESKTREYGKATIIRKSDSDVINKAFDGSTVWMSHGTHVSKPPEGFEVTYMSDDTLASIENTEKKIYGFQFHPEVSHTEHGKEILEAFIDKCGFSKDWSASSIIDEQVAKIKETVGDKNVICALSGGVDSSVAATLVNKAVGDKQTCIFVDTGLLRKNEYEEVLEIYKDQGLNVKPIKAGERFLSKLNDVSDPEEKRKIIGNEFISIFEEEAGKLTDVGYLVQGTLYPDVIESVSVNGPSVTIKSHHNVGGLPEKMNLELIEPL
ncbi:MAG TPA: glutamine-hydrolyzing GMP synthase, partial [Candidatus Saccharimonadales bacterium]|nr:glutamine-hydrolyzing GMP synthase [Candidatus Saccharimonadales bacterium]